LGRVTACFPLKGWFRTQDGQRVETLTVRDLFIRYLLSVRLFRNQSWRSVRRVFLRLFREQGFPRVIRMDNGSPFGTTGPAVCAACFALARCGRRVENPAE